MLCCLVNKKACGSFFKLHEKCCFTISTLSQSDNRLYFYEEPQSPLPILREKSSVTIAMKIHDKTPIL